MNKTRFSVTQRNVLRFALSIAELTLVVAARFSTKNTVKIIASLKAKVKASVIVRATKAMIAAKATLKVKAITNIIVKTKIAATTKAIVNMPSTGIYLRNKISGAGKLFSKTSTRIKFKPVINAFSMLGIFTKLQDHDAKTLGTMDNVNLQDIDFITV